MLVDYLFSELRSRIAITFVLMNKGAKGARGVSPQLSHTRNIAQMLYFKNLTKCGFD